MLTQETLEEIESISNTQLRSSVESQPILSVLTEFMQDHDAEIALKSNGCTSIPTVVIYTIKNNRKGIAKTTYEPKSNSFKVKKTPSGKYERIVSSLEEGLKTAYNLAMTDASDHPPTM